MRSFGCLYIFLFVPLEPLRAGLEWISGVFKSVIRSATPDCSAEHRDMILMNDLYIASPEGVSPKDGQSALLVISCVGTHRMAP